jgi:hypothetical protein
VHLAVVSQGWCVEMVGGCSLGAGGVHGCRRGLLSAEGGGTWCGVARAVWGSRWRWLARMACEGVGGLFGDMRDCLGVSEGLLTVLLGWLAAFMGTTANKPAQAAAAMHATPHPIPTDSLAKHTFNTRCQPNNKVTSYKD